MALLVAFYPTRVNLLIARHHSGSPFHAGNLEISTTTIGSSVSSFISHDRGVLASLGLVGPLLPIYWLLMMGSLVALKLMIV